MANIVSLSEAASIALHGVVLLAQEKKPLNVIEISEKIGSSKHHVSKIFQRLSKDGFVSSQRGPSGGFTLECDTKNTSLLQIYESIEGKLNVLNCPINHPICPFNNCILGDVTQKMTKVFRDYLQSMKLSDYVNDKFMKPKSK